MCRIRFLAVVVLFLASADRAGAQVEAPLSDRVPRDALLYAGWAGADELQQRYAGSHAEALFNQSSLAQVFEQTLPRLGAALSKQKPDAKPWVKFSTDILPILYRHPTAIAFGGIDTTNPDQPLPRILLICDAGEDAALLRNKLGELFAMVKNVGLFTLMDVQDGVLYLNLGWQKLDLAIARDDPTKALASDDRFVSAMQEMIEQPVSAVFLDVPGLVRVAEEAARRDKGEPAVQDLHKFLDASGLRGLGSVTLTTGFQDKQYATSLFVESRSPRTGLLGLLESEPIDLALLRQIPADAGFVAAGRFDLSKLLQAARNAIQVTQPDTAGDFEQGLRFINMLVGADLENDLLGGLGKSWAAYTAPATGDTAPGIVAINRPADATRLRSAMRNLSLSLVSLVNQNAQEKNEPFRLTGREIDVAGGSVYFLDLPLVAPSWSVSEDLAYFGLYPQSIASAQVTAAPEDNFADSAAFESVRQLAGEHPIRGFTYIDLPRYSGRAYGQINALLQVGSGVLSGFGETSNITARVPPMVLPPYATFREHVTPIIGITWVDDRGLHLRSLAPFPFSGVLTLGMQ